MTDLSIADALACLICASTAKLVDESPRPYVRCAKSACFACGPYCDTAHEALRTWNVMMQPRVVFECVVCRAPIGPVDNAAWDRRGSMMHARCAPAEQKSALGVAVGDAVAEAGIELPKPGLLARLRAMLGRNER